jgi:cysteine synthase
MTPLLSSPSKQQEQIAAATRNLAHIAGLIGNTPLLGIEFSYAGRRRTIYAKCEQLSLTGSIKDRMALHILKSAYASGALHPGDTITEVTSGNTGIAFAALGRALGHPVTIFMPDWMSHERKDLIRSYGAAVVPVSKEQGGFVGSIRMAEEMAANREDVFLPRQFSNAANTEAHEATTGPEIWAQLERIGRQPDAFVAGVGTGGTIMGVARFLRSRNPKVKVHAVEPAESPTLSTGRKVGKHRIQGISDEFIPAIVDLSALDKVIAVCDGDSIIMAQKLASTLGLAVGISSGCNFLAALMVQEELGPDAAVVTVFPDDNKKYLSTDLTKEEPALKNYMAPEVALSGFTSMQRVCKFCEDRI